MATSKEYLNFILDQLSGIDGITPKQMTGEYIIYHHGKIAAYLCDDRNFLTMLFNSMYDELPEPRKKK